MMSASIDGTPGVPRDSDPAGQPQSWPPPEPAPVSGGMIAGMIVLALLVPLIGPAIALFVGAAQIRRRGALALVWTGGILLPLHMLFALMFLIAAPSFVKIRMKTHEAEVKMNLNAIQNALTRYARDNDGIYPDQIEGMEDPKVYLPVEFETDVPNELQYVFRSSYHPKNPVTGKDTRDITFGAKPFAGECTYIPVEIDGEVKGYYLLAYGYESTPGMDVDGDGEPDHVIQVLCSGAYGETREDWVACTSDGQPLPPLEELLNK